MLNKIQSSCVRSYTCLSLDIHPFLDILAFSGGVIYGLSWKRQKRVSRAGRAPATSAYYHLPCCRNSRSGLILPL